MNNSVRDWQGNVIGFRCFTCGEIYQSGWGNHCNGCRNKADENARLRAEISKLTEAIKQLTPLQSQDIRS